MLDRDDEAAAAFVARIPAWQVAESWQFIEPNGERSMHGPGAVRLLEELPVTRPIAWVLRTFHLGWLATGVNRALDRVRKPLGRFFPDTSRPRRWP